MNKLFERAYEILPVTDVVNAEIYVQNMVEIL